VIIFISILCIAKNCHLSSVNAVFAPFTTCFIAQKPQTGTQQQTVWRPCFTSFAPCLS